MILYSFKTESIHSKIQQIPPMKDLLLTNTVCRQMFMLEVKSWQKTHEDHIQCPSDLPAECYIDFSVDCQYEKISARKYQTLIIWPTPIAKQKCLHYLRWIKEIQGLPRNQLRIHLSFVGTVSSFHTRHITSLFIKHVVKGHFNHVLGVHTIHVEILHEIVQAFFQIT